MGEPGTSDVQIDRDSAIRRKRIRAGQKASATRIMAQAQETIDAPQTNCSALKRFLSVLHEKRDIILKMDAEILNDVGSEEEIVREIEEADVYRERIEMAVIAIEQAISETERASPLHIRQGEESASEPVNQQADRLSPVNQLADRRSISPTPSDAQARVAPPSQVDNSHSSPKQVQPGSTTMKTPKVKLPKLTLKKFSGDPTAWTPFWDSYESAIHQNPDLLDIDKFNYLQSLVEHSAAEAIAGLTLSSSNYAEAITVLKKRFGNKQQLINKHMEALLSLPAVTSVYELRNLRQLYDKVESHVRSLKSIGIAASSYGNLLASILMKKIPSDLCLIVSRETVEDNWDLDSLLKVLEKEIEARERAATNTSAQPRKPVRDYSTAAALLSDTSSPLCAFCDQPHYSTHCRVVTDHEKRKQLLLKGGRCFICLKKGHLSRDCRSSRGCYNCGGRHHSSICKSQRSGPRNAQNTTPTSTEQPQNVRPQMQPQQHQTQSAPVLSMYVDVKTPVLLQTARASVFQPNRPSLTTIVRIILDSGSQRSYVTEMVRKNLALHTEQAETIVMKTFGCHEKVQICDVVKLAIKTATGTDLVLPFLVVPSICEPIAGQPITLARDTYPHLFGLNLADDSGRSESLAISILIGADHYWKLATGRVRRGKTGPTAIETVLGWVLSGPVPGITFGETSTNLISAHALKLETSVLQCHDCDLDQRLKKFWDLETLGIKEGEMPAYSQFMEGITFQDGRYCVQLPWKNPHPTLPDNFKLSQRRLCGLLRRLRQEPSLLQRYDTVIKEQLKEGIVEVVQDPWTSVMEKVHYIPHHGVIRDDKQTTKLRIVYDASAQEWRQFVHNRVNEIRTLVPAQRWKHCSGHDNPADLPSRGISLPELLNKSVWFSGPSWLSSPVQASCCDEELMPDECILEMKKSAQHVLLVGGEIGTVIQCQRFSSLGRLLRVTAYVLKFIAVLKVRGSVSAGLSSKDVSDAEEFWIKSSQAVLLKDAKFQVWKTQFGLYCDNEIWRCGGRLRNADLDVCAKHPILLPSSHHFTMLVIRQSHEKVLHGGVKETLTELRSRFWIVKGRSVVKKLLHKCVVCKKIDGKPYASSLPPPLPEFRVTQSPPFAFTGLDYAGPLYLRGTEDKVWICLFTCCATRALHLDLVVDMTTEAFIRCFKRFVARRGIPRVIISDNSKTFKAADKVIAEILNRPEIEEFFAGVRVKWNFNLEKAPWWGGFFERLVKSTKRCLKKIIGTTRLSYEELQTVLVEVDAILNSRPLTYVSSEDLEEPLTPSHLLTGRRLISLPDPQDSEDDPDYHASHTPEVLTRRMKHLTVMLDHFWKRWKWEYLVELREMHRYAQKPTTPHEPVSVGDVVLVYDEDHPRIFWKLAKVEGLLKGSDGVVRGAKVRVRSGNGFTVLKRPVQHLFPLEVNVDNVSVAEDVKLRLSQQKGQDEKEVQEEKKVRPARASAQRARQKITEWMKSN